MTDARIVIPLLLAGLLCACATTTKGSAPVDDGVGKPLPAIELTDLQGGTAALADTGGQVVLLDFWATWCKPCMKSMPVYDGWQTELKERGFLVRAVSVDAAGAPVGEFAERLAPSVQVLLDPEGRAPEALALDGLPVAFLVGRDGIVRSRHLGFHAKDAPELKAQIEALLAEPAP